MSLVAPQLYMYFGMLKLKVLFPDFLGFGSSLPKILDLDFGYFVLWFAGKEIKKRNLEAELQGLDYFGITTCMTHFWDPVST